MASRFRSKYRPGSMPSLDPAIAMAGEQAPPPTSALINVILEYADVQQNIGGGRAILRLSPRRMKDPVIRGVLGRETKRLADVSLIWDEEEGAIIRVLDAAADAQARPPQEDLVDELDTFELTEAALDYVARYQSRRRG